MLFNYTSSFLHSIWYFTHSHLSMLSPYHSLSPLPISLSHFSLPISLCSLSLERESKESSREKAERADRDQERERDQGVDWEIEERDRGRESLHVLGNGEPPLGDDTDKNHHDGEPPEIVLLLLSIRERSSFFSASNEETTTRLQRGRRASDLGNFFLL